MSAEYEPRRGLGQKCPGSSVYRPVLSVSARLRRPLQRTPETFRSVTASTGCGLFVLYGKLGRVKGGCVSLADLELGGCWDLKLCWCGTGPKKKPCCLRGASRALKAWFRETCGSLTALLLGCHARESIIHQRMQDDNLGSGRGPITLQSTPEGGCGSYGCCGPEFHGRRRS